MHCRGSSSRNSTKGIIPPSIHPPPQHRSNSVTKVFQGGAIFISNDIFVETIIIVILVQSSFCNLANLSFFLEILPQFSFFIFASINVKLCFLDIINHYFYCHQSQLSIVISQSFKTRSSRDVQSLVLKQQIIQIIDR